jgi:hypothetical protein
VKALAEGPHQVSLTGLDERTREALADPSARARILVVRTLPEQPGGPPVAGAYTLDAQGLHFRPLFRFAADLQYVATATMGAKVLSTTFSAEAPRSRAPPRVVALHPGSDVLPANTLRVYLHFSRPMAARDTARRVRLLDDGGRDVPLAFVEFGDGLWDPDRTRLTVLFHPGRIKRGVAPGERLGPPLVAGRSYRLVVDGTMADTDGVPLGTPYQHAFRAGPDDREPPRGDAVAVEPPAADGALVVRLPEPLDRALLQRLVWVEDAEGRTVAGEVTIDASDTAWTFRPASGWKAGDYAVRLAPALEDRAGNRFDRPFDRDEGADVAEPPPLRFPFRVP